MTGVTPTKRATKRRGGRGWGGIGGVSPPQWRDRPETGVNLEVETGNSFAGRVRCQVESLRNYPSGFNLAGAFRSFELCRRHET